MSALAKRLPRSSPVVSASDGVHLRIVPTPAPRRGFFAVLAICAALIVGALFASFAINTAMVKTAFEIRQIQQSTDAAKATESTLEDEILQLSSPAGLASRAEELGLSPAAAVRHVDLKAGTILETANDQGE